MSDDRPPTYSEQFNRGYNNPHGFSGSLAELQGREAARARPTMETGVIPSGPGTTLPQLVRRVRLVILVLIAAAALIYALL